MKLIKKLVKITFKIITIPNIFFTKKFFKKIVFLHPPHCGGNSIHRFLKYNFGFRGKKIIVDANNNVSDELEDGEDHFYNFGHFGFDFIKSNFNNDDYFHLLTVRNPKNIYLSNYYRNKKYRKMYDPEAEFPTLEEFLTNIQKVNKDNLLCRYLSGLFIYKPNKTKMTDQVFNKAVINLESFKFIFVVEFSKECFKNLTNKLKIIMNFASIFKNKANKHSDSKYPQISKEAERLLESMTYYDNKLYKIILTKKKLKKTGYRLK